MSLSELLERLGRGVFEAPFGALSALNDSPEVAEIRFALLDEIKKKTQRAGGREIFPYDLIRIHLRCLNEKESAVFEGDFFRHYFEQEVHQHFAKTECRVPDDLCVEVRVEEFAGMLGKDWIRVETSSQQPAPAPPTRRRTPATLVVIAGSANQPEVPLAKLRANVGRVQDVYKSEGLSRRNDLVFAADTPINRTVSREHAHILYHKESDEYRLYNDRWYTRGNKTESNCGIWIIRDGMGQEVHRDTRGTKLEPGDEIHFGKAVVEFRTA
ncbi:MAG: FHA domain-containing protein [Bryobacteraceae bacterium]